MKRVFIDSDIILDALLRREPFAAPALHVLELAHTKQLKIFSSAVAMINTNYFVNKQSPNSGTAALKQLRMVVGVTTVDEKIIDTALNSSFSDFEDAVQYFAAKSNSADVILTRNKKDYKHAEIPVLTADEFLKTL